MVDRIFHNYLNWEDYIFGMYETATKYLDPKQLIKENEFLLSIPEFLLESMLFVSHRWTISSEQNLSNLNRNRQAWLGQAACCFVNGSPEYLTKIAWNNLSIEKQNKANEIADYVILDWEEKYKMGYFNGKN